MTNPNKMMFPTSMDLPYDKDFYKQYGVFVKPINYSLSSKKVESLLAIAEMQRYFQCNPLRWIDLMYNIELLDAQALAIQRTWIAKFILICASRGIGKSTIVDLETMAKDSLFCNVWSYIASGTGDQAQNTFITLEKLANDNIDTFEGSTGKLFKDEVVVKAASGDGFSHNPSGFNYQLYNGSQTSTLNSNVDSKRGYRGSVIFDESGWLSEEMMKVFSAFAIVNKSFKTGKVDGKSIDPIRQRTFATNIPNQLFYISSASSTDTPFYKLYRDYAKQQIMGNPDFVCLHLDCELAFSPTLRGEAISPLLTRETVRSEMRTNPLKAQREYYCMFTTDGGVDAIVKRGTITRNEKVYKPILENETGDKKYIICYDPARQRDNSFILVIEMYETIGPDKTVDLHGKIVNGINLMDTGKKIKSPMQLPDQIKYLKKIICDYNGGADGYENIIGVYIDAGSGGGGVDIADYLMPDWTDEAGTHHRGLIDKEYSKEYVSRFPNAVDKVHLMSPSGFKSIMYESLIEMVNQDKIDFPAPYDNKGYLMVFDTDDELLNKEKQKIVAKLKKQKVSDDELDQKVQEELSKVQSVKTKMIKLDFWEESALSQIDALKEEVVNMVRKKRDSGKDSFELTADKANKMHDDRAYTLALGSYALAQERRKLILKKPKSSNDDLLDKLRKTMKKGGAR